MVLRIFRKCILRYKLKNKIITLSWRGKKIEPLGVPLLILFVITLLSISWRKWSDPHIDYGRELYIPWLMSEGGKLFKDVDDLYGPLSRFVDAGLFKIFGPGIMVLALANLFFYAVILYMLYRLFKGGWGILAALVACFVFVGIFSFSQLTVISNYNFITPYSQQVTHGFLVCLVLIYVLVQWIQKQTLILSILAGFLVGLTFVLKPEFILASVLLALVSVAIHFKTSTRIRLGSIMAAGLSACIPTVLFYLYFLTYLSPYNAGLAAAHAWLNGLFIWKDPLTTHLLNNFSGMDNPKSNALLHLLATVYAMGLITFIAVSAFIIDRLRVLVIQVGVLTASVGILFYLTVRVINWSNVGQCLFGLLCCYGVYLLINAYRKLKSSKIEVSDYIQLLMTVYALALLTRMVLNGRIFQYGFIQASIAAMVIVAALLGDSPLFELLGKYGSKLFRLGFLFILSVAIVSTINNSNRLLSAKTLAIGRGADLVYTYPSNILMTGQIVGTFSDLLSKQTSDKSIIVIPEGIMINYLARKKSPVSDVNFYTGASAESVIVSKLKKSAPSWIIYISRDLTEYGVSQFGSKGQSGEELMNWIKANYHTVISMGGDPSNAKQVAGLIYELNAPQASIGRVDPSVVKP